MKKIITIASCIVTFLAPVHLYGMQRLMPRARMHAPTIIHSSLLNVSHGAKPVLVRQFSLLKTLRGFREKSNQPKINKPLTQIQTDLKKADEAFNFCAVSSIADLNKEASANIPAMHQAFDKAQQRNELAQTIANLKPEQIDAMNKFHEICQKMLYVYKGYPFAELDVKALKAQHKELSDNLEKVMPHKKECDTVYNALWLAEKRCMQTPKTHFIIEADVDVTNKPAASTLNKSKYSHVYDHLNPVLTQWYKRSAAGESCLSLNKFDLQVNPIEETQNYVLANMRMKADITVRTHDPRAELLEHDLQLQAPIAHNFFDALKQARADSQGVAQFKHGTIKVNKIKVDKQKS
jgi:hypothetical protein